MQVAWHTYWIDLLEIFSLSLKWKMNFSHFSLFWSIIQIWCLPFTLTSNSLLCYVNKECKHRYHPLIFKQYSVCILQHSTDRLILSKNTFELTMQTNPLHGGNLDLSNKYFRCDNHAFKQSNGWSSNEYMVFKYHGINVSWPNCH
jgi:hypothetical protein